MNRRIVFFIVGKILMVEAVLLLLPAAVALIYGESCLTEILISAVIALAVGLVFSIKKPGNRNIYAREGFTIVAAAWILMSAIGSLPFWLSREIPSFVDAFFETVSGFTTTGATILTNVEAMSKSLLFWRSFTHWVGGMGVLVFVMAIIPLGDNRSMHLMRAEVPGPVVGKLVPRAKDTAKILYGIYIGLTVLQTILLMFGGMSLFDSLIHAFGTAGTGGFSSYNASVGHFNSVYIDVVITVFMALFGINFTLIYLVLLREFKTVLKNEELRWYFAIMLGAMLIIALDIMDRYSGFWEALRYSSFQVSSVMTTTGYSTTDFNLWPNLSRFILVLIMFGGACAGSTGGGMKIVRLTLLWKIIRREVKKLIHPRSVNAVKMDGKTVPEETLSGVTAFFVVYVFVAVGTVFILAFDCYDFETNFSAMAACLNNIGPGLNAVGPAGNFSGYSIISKIVLSLNMLIGRLEIFPILLALTPSVWRKKR